MNERKKMKRQLVDKYISNVSVGERSQEITF